MLWVKSNGVELTWLTSSTAALDLIDFIQKSHVLKDKKTWYQLNFSVKSTSKVVKYLLKSRLRIEVRPTENDLTRLYKNGDILVVITCSWLKFGR